MVGNAHPTDWPWISGIPCWKLSSKSPSKTRWRTVSTAMVPHINVPKTEVADFCRRHHIYRLAFFGSVLRNDFRSDSDVDVLVEFTPGERVGLIRLARMQMELERILKRKVDLRTPAELSRYFRDAVVNGAGVEYVQLKGIWASA